MARFSFDDGCASDMRLLDLLQRYEISEAVFYIPIEWHNLAYQKGYEPLTYPELLMIAKQYEIGSHGITHRYLTKIPYEQAVYELNYSKFMLSLLTGQEITKFAYPRGYTNKEISEVADKLYEEARLTRGDNLVHIHPNSGANDNKDWKERVIEIDDPHLWAHSWELDKYDLWGEFEEWLHDFSSQQQ